MKKGKVILLSVISVLSVIALVLLAVSLIVTKGILKYYDVDQIQTSPLLTSSTKLEYGTLVASTQDLAHFKNVTQDGKTVTTVYNIETGAVVYTHTKEATDTSTVSVAMHRAQTQPFFVVTVRNQNQTVTSSTLYNAAGTALASAAKDPEFVLYNHDVIAFNGNAYTVNEDGVLTRAFVIDDFCNISATANATVVGREYLYFRKSDSIVVTDKQGDLVASYQIKAYDSTIEHFSWNVLENGNVVAQYAFALPDVAEDYDILRTENGVTRKYDVVTELWKVSSDKVKDVDVEYLLREEIINYNVAPAMKTRMEEGFSKNLTYIQRFEDGRLLPDEELVVIDNRLNIDATAEDIVKGAIAVEKITEDWYKVTDSYGYTHIVDRHGKVEKTISGTFEVTKQYFVTDHVIYDFEFNPVYDFHAQGYELASAGADGVILKKTVETKTEYARYTNGSLTVIKAAQDLTSVVSVNSAIHSLYCIVATNEAGTLYHYYNGKGALVASFHTSVSVRASAQNGAVLVQSGTDYFRISP